jgi:AraC family transcriptional regulator of adaptative response/methylated-DNA-[protein]-cysteine methyltransferase
MDDIDLSQACDDYRRIEKAIRFLEENFRSRLTLDGIAESVHLSKYHFDRLFKRWVGISPMQFQQFLTLDYAKQKLADSRSLLDTAYDAGFSGPGRLHDLFVTFEAMTPGEYKKMGAGLKIAYGFDATPFGKCLLAKTDRGICHLGFMDTDTRTEALYQLEQVWPEAAFVEDPTRIRPLVRSIFRRDRHDESRPFHLLLKGTNFQVNVWKALLTLPARSILSYQDVAVYMGRPKAVRAVANAIAVNPVAYLIPCHRVIAKSGKIHHYRWGTLRKKAIIGWEASL